MKAIAHLRQSLSIQDQQQILDVLNTVMDINTIDLDMENGVLILGYQNRLALDMVERKLWNIGYPITYYSYPDRRPLNLDASDPDESSFV